MKPQDSQIHFCVVAVVMDDEASVVAAALASRLMAVDRPAPGEELNLGEEPTRPRQAATVIVLRGDAATLEILLVQRNPAQRFMGGAWVFPGGAVDAADAG